MRPVCLLISLVFTSYTPSSGNRYALLIGIGQYPITTRAEPVSARNDLAIMQNTLLQQGFPASHLVTLADAQATRRAIETRLDSLARILPVGSCIVVFFSGHGLQIADDNHDEADGLDEAILPYDGKPSLPATLLRDDQLGRFLTRLRTRVGAMGHVLFLFDSCHSGSILRGSKATGLSRGIPNPQPVMSTNPTPGTSGWFGEGTVTHSASRLGRYALIAATTDGQPSYECADTNGKPYGPLTLAVCRAWREQPTRTYRSFFSGVQQHMARLSPYQLPTLEGDADAPFLGNSL